MTTNQDPDQIRREIEATRRDLSHNVNELGETVQDNAHDVASTVEDVPQMARRQTRGNPLAVGAVALAAGWLVSSLLPASDKEREAAHAIQEKAQPLVDQGREEITQVGQEMGEHLREPAQEAADEVKSSAQEGLEHVKSEGQSATEDVKDSASQAKDDMQSLASWPGTRSRGSPAAADRRTQCRGARQPASAGVAVH